MAYINDIERNEAPPFAELYEITSDGVTYYLTSYINDIEFNGIVYKRCIIGRSTINTSIQVVDSSLNISLYVGESISSMFLKGIITSTKVTLKRLILDTLSYTTLFTGVVSGVSYSNNFITLKVDNILNTNAKIIPVVYYQKYCNNQLFDKNCGVSRVDYSDLITSDKFTYDGDTTITSTLFSNKPDNWYRYGVVSCNNSYRLILSHVGDTIIIQYPFEEDISNNNIIVEAGCNKTIDECINKFNNSKNYLGFLYIPEINPVVWGLK